MLIRERTEEYEEQTLSPHAVLSKNTRGREREEKKCDIRTEFQRDRDRVIHSKAFRRLKDKTQVFIAPQNDHMRTRLTHTLEVTQIARTIARALRLNEDLTEAIGLGHDLGHTPFGHDGERALNELSPHGFAHYKQSLRVVDFLEDGGLNLTWEVRDGIVNHTGDHVAHTLEGRIIKYADRIAYLNHDIDDAFRAGIIDHIPEEFVKALGEDYSARINTFIMDLVFQSLGHHEIQMSPQMQKVLDNLRSFMFKNVYTSTSKFSPENVKFVIERLYHYFLEHPDRMPEMYHQYLKQYDACDVVCDFIAGMSDKYAIHLFQDLFVPHTFIEDL